MYTVEIYRAYQHQRQNYWIYIRAGNQMLRPIRVYQLVANHWVHSNSISSCLNLDSSSWYYKPIPFQLHSQMKQDRLHIYCIHSERDSMILDMAQKTCNTTVSHFDVSMFHPDSLKCPVHCKVLIYLNKPEYTDFKYKRSINNFIYFWNKFLCLNHERCKYCEYNKIVSMILKVS